MSRKRFVDLSGISLFKNKITELLSNHISDDNIHISIDEKNKLSAIESNQSDWNVTDQNSNAYIKNKPTIPEGTVTGVKGDAESSYRTGNVNITPGNIGVPTNQYIADHFAADVASTKLSNTTTAGWYRIAESCPNHYYTGGVGGYCSCVITLKRAPAGDKGPEFQKVQLFEANDIFKLVSLSAFSSDHVLAKIRLVHSQEKSYIEIYQDASFSQCTILVGIENANGIFEQNWKAIDATKTGESVAGVTVKASLDLPANFDLSYIPNGKVPISAVGKDGYIAYPEDGYLDNDSDTITGYLRIRFPNIWTANMIKFTVSIYNYLTGESADYIVSGYPYHTGTWYNCSAVCIGRAGSAHSNLAVRFGYKDNKNVISIGEADTIWKYPKVQIHDILVGANYTGFDRWKSGWNIDITQEEMASTQIYISNTHVAYGGISSSCTGNAATATKATQDGNGNNIASTYLTKTGKAASATTADSATSATTATKATQDGNGNDIASTYLPKAGGTITGNLTLKGSGNYGNKINFGDGNYVYLYEDTDDHLTIYGSSGINLVTGSASNPVTINGKAINGNYQNALWLYKGKASYRGGSCNVTLDGISEVKFIIKRVDGTNYLYISKEITVPYEFIINNLTYSNIIYDGESSENFKIQSVQADPRIIRVLNNYYLHDVEIYAR